MFDLLDDRHDPPFTDATRERIEQRARQLVVRRRARAVAMAAAVIVLAVGLPLALVRPGGHPRRLRTVEEPTSTVGPATFVDAALSPTGQDDTIEVRSTATGAVVRSLTHGVLLVGFNNLARSADGSTVAYLHYGGQGFATVATNTGASTESTGGSSPTFSGDGRYLAFWDESPGDPNSDHLITLLDRTAGTTRSVNVTSAFGPGYVAAVGDSFAWLAGSHRVAFVVYRAAPVVVGGVPIPGGPTTPPTTAPQPMPKLVVVDVDAPDPMAQAVVIDAPPNESWQFVAAGTSPQTVVVGRTLGARHDLVIVDVDRRGHPQQVLATLPADVVPLSLDRTDSHLLYFEGSNSELRHAAIGHGALINPVVVPGRFSAASW